MEYVMGIDLGTSSVKAVVMGRDGQVTAAAGREYPVLRPREGYGIQDPLEWWAGTKEVIRRAVDLGGILPGQIKAIGFSGQMHGLTALDGRGRPVMPAMIWEDQRSEKEGQEILELVRRNGLEKELMNRPVAGMMICSLLWVKKNLPDIYRNIAHVLLPKDYIRYRLGGGFDTDETDAGGSLAFSVRDRRWCGRLLEALDIREDLFPEVRKPYDIVGQMTAKAAEETGLTEGTPLAAGGADSAMQLTGNGIVEEGTLCCNIGTASQILAASRVPLYDRELRTQTFCHSVPGLWYTQCGSLNGGNGLRWLKKDVLKTEDSYEKLSQLAGTVEPGSGGLLFLPYLAGERTPYQAPHARGAFLGLSLTQGQTHMVRSVMEGVAMNLRQCYELFPAMGLEGHQSMVVSGGGARSGTWRQILADVFNLPVYRTTVREEACTGAAFMAAVALGWYPSAREAARHVVRREEEPAAPVSGHVEVYCKMRERFNRGYEALRFL